MSLIIINCPNELKSLKKYSCSSKSLYYSNTSYSKYEIFVGYNMLEFFSVIKNAIKFIRRDERKSIFTAIIS